MNPVILRYIGGPGTGKTKQLLDTMSRLIEGGRSPRSIGFVSFTRAARAEAAERAASLFDVSISDLTQTGWFRTVHSCCYQLLGIGKCLLEPSKKTDEWISSAVGYPYNGGSADLESDEYLPSVVSNGEADIALAIWSLARNSLLTLKEIHDRAEVCTDNCPRYEICAEIVSKYEQAKRRDERVDFCDILGLYSGIMFGIDGHEQWVPSGDIPNVPVWFIDEAQDNSPLVDAVLKRITSGAEIVYICLDPFQAIHGWMGADPNLAMRWPAAKEKTLGISHRCASEILRLGEMQISGCANYFDRGIKPARTGGVFDTIYGDWLNEVNPLCDTLVLCRTNFHARRISAKLNGASMPWVPIKGRGGWNAPSRNRAIDAILRLENGGSIEPADWSAILDYVPSKSNGSQIIMHGAKTIWKEREERGRRNLADIAEWGATEFMVESIRSGKWHSWIENAAQFVAAVHELGREVALNPRIRLGTIHSAKGMEAERVFIYSAASRPVWLNRTRDQDGADQEARLAYVGITRAKNEVYLIPDSSQRYAMEFVT